MKSFLQTTEWLEFQKSLGRKTVRFHNGVIEANIIKHDLPFGKNYLYIPHGPEINFEAVKGGFKNEINQFLHFLRGLGKQEKSLFVKIEPMTDTVAQLLVESGMRKSLKTLQPQKTVVLDLMLDDYDLLGQMHHKTRYNINLASRKNLSVGVSADHDQFWKLLEKTSLRDKFSTHPQSYYEKLLTFFKDSQEVRTELFLTMYEGKAIAGAITLIHDETVYYLHGASDNEYRNLMAPHAMHWEIMKHYKAQGFTEYDLWGIDAQRWPGVTRFKLGFGGKVIERPGAFDLPLSKFWYFAYNLARKLTR